MRRAAVLLALACAGCGASDGGAVLFDEDYALETFATNADGIVSPDGLAWHAGALLVADEGGSAVRRIGSRGAETLADRRSGLRSPEDLAIGDDGTIHVSDDTAGGVWVITRGLAVRLPGSGEAERPTEGLAADPHGRILAGEGESGRIVAYAPGGRPVALPCARLAKPESMAFDDAGMLWIADNRADALYLCRPGTRTLEAVVRREGFSPESIAWIGGALWITDSHNGKLYRMDADGELETVAQFAGALENIQGLAGDPRGNVYVSVQTNLDAGQGVILRMRKRS